MDQDHGQPIQSFVAKVKGNVQVCSFTKSWTGPNCEQQFNYTEHFVKYAVISTIAEEITKKDVFLSSIIWVPHDQL